MKLNEGFSPLKQSVINIDDDYFEKQKAYEKQVWNNLDQEMVQECVYFIHTHLSPEDKIWFEENMKLYKSEWPIQNGFHLLGGGMSFRNWLRQNEFGEKEFKIENLDYIYTKLIELAVIGKVLEK